MKIAIRLIYSILLYSSIALMFGSCGQGGEIVRTLHFVDLDQIENRSFKNYPNDFSTNTLRGILEESLQAYQIDYDSSGAITKLDINEFKNRLADPFLDYEFDQDVNPAEDWTLHDFEDYLLSVSLVGLDEIKTENGSYEPQYINFYHPGEVTPEGINRYICSVSFKDMVDYLYQTNPSFLWHNLKVADWGWYGHKVFVSEIATSSRLAMDLLTFDTSLVSKRLSASSDRYQLQELMLEGPHNFHSRFINTSNGEVKVFFKNDSISTEIALFELKDLVELAQKKSQNDTVSILPLPAALYQHRFVMNGRSLNISENGRFADPLSGKDPLSASRPRAVRLTKEQFDLDQQFVFRTVERLIEERPEEVNELPELLYQGVQTGELWVHNNESLINRLIPGNFFDNIILDEQDNIPADRKYLEVYQVVVESIFRKDGSIISQNTIGIGLFLPGNQVPEGFNRPVGFFKTDDINDYLKSLNKPEINFNDLRGYPLKSSNIEVYQLN